MSRTAVASLVLGAAAFASPSWAATKDVLLIGGGSPLKEAVTVALSAWDLRVVGTDDTVPPTDAPRAAREARAIARRHGAAGLVWIGGQDRDLTLFVYDADTEQLVSRALAQPLPFDAPAAAAAALSVKTLLRSSTVAPPEERLGALAPTPAPSPAAEPPVHESATRDAVAADPPSRARGAIEIGGNARAIGGDADLRVAVGGTWFLGARRAIGVGVSLRGGPGLGIDSPLFRGRFDELAIAPSARARVALTRALRLEPRVGLTFHATRVDGVVVASAEAATRSRVDGSIDGGAVLETRLSGDTYVGLDVEGSWVLRYQRYLVRDTSVLALAPLQGSVGLRIAVGLP